MIVALRHLRLAISFFKLRWLHWVTELFAAVGRVARTNYLVESLICTTLFCGCGFGLIGHLARTARTR